MLLYINPIYVTFICAVPVLCTAADIEPMPG